MFVETINPGEFNLKTTGVHFEQSNIEGPLVSCLMVTRGNESLVSTAINSYLAQNYNNKELIIVCDNLDSNIDQFIEINRGEKIKYIKVPKKLSLGELRNISIEEAGGEIICQWDDDDLYNVNRLTASVCAIQNASISAVFLKRWFVWWPSKSILTISHPRVWEGSMVVTRDAVKNIKYSKTTRGEDTAFVNQLWLKERIGLIDYPHLYIYRITGQNTWDENHFDYIINRSSRIFSAIEYESVIKQLGVSGKLLNELSF